MAAEGSCRSNMLHVFVAATCVLEFGCHTGTKEAPASAGASAESSGRAISSVGQSPPSPGSSASAEPITLHFSGTYEASLHRLELPAAKGGLPEWAADDPRRGTGHGTIELEIAEGNKVSGEANGPLGRQSLSGSFEAGKIFARLQSGDAAGYNGTLVATQDGHRMSGTIQAAAGDSRSSRTAAVVLSQK